MEKIIHDCHFKIADIERIFGSQCNDQIKHFIIISVKDEMYTKEILLKMLISQGR